MPDVVVVLDFPSNYYKYVYRQKPDLAEMPYEQQRQTLLSESYGGIADAYEMRFREAGLSATTLLANGATLQSQWAREQGVRSVANQLPQIDRMLQYDRLPRKLRSVLSIQRQRLFNQVFLAQIAHYRPQVLLVRMITSLPAEIMQAARQFTKVVLGHLDTPFPAHADLYGVIDLVFTPFLHYARFLQDCGLDGRYLPLAFEPRFLERCVARYGPVDGLSHDAVFLGSVSPQHVARMQWLTALSESGQVDFWTSLDAITAEQVPQSIVTRSHPPVFGLEMLDVYRRARIALNAHPEISGPYAGIFRLFEATGAGAMLLTDEKKNLDELFAPGREVITYTDTADAVAKLEYYLLHEDERAEIAAAGQQRTLTEHTYEQRVAQLLIWLEPWLG